MMNDLQKEMDKRYNLIEKYESQLVQLKKDLKNKSLMDNFNQEEVIQIIEKTEALQKVLDDLHIELNYLYVEQTTKGL